MAKKKSGTQTQRARLVSMASGLVALDRLLAQIRLTDARVRNEMGKIAQIGTYESSGPELRELVRLDTETFYRIGHDVLKLVALFLKTRELHALKSDARFKAITSIRSALITHAYDGRHGDPSNVFGYDSLRGFVLKGGIGIIQDHGYVPNYDSFWGLLETHKITERFPFSTMPILTESMRRRLTGEEQI